MNSQLPNSTRPGESLKFNPPNSLGAFTPGRALVARGGKGQMSLVPLTTCAVVTLASGSGGFRFGLTLRGLAYKG